jgi:hypothetical protein
MNKSKILIISLALILMLSTISLAQGSASVFKFGVDAKSLAMGGAFVAVADNYAAAYWNPAGLATVGGLTLGGMNFKPYDVDGLNFLFGAGAMPLGNFTVGGGYASFTASDVGWSYSETLMMGSVALGLGDLGYAGASVKQYSLKGPEATADGLGFDVGLLMSLGDFHLGAAGMDIGGTELAWGGKVAQLFRVGAALPLGENILVAAGMDTGETQVIRAGMQFQAVEQLAIRAGIVMPQDGEMSFTAGAGLTLANISVDVAWLQNKTGFADFEGTGDTLVMSAQLTL